MGHRAESETAIENTKMFTIFAFITSNNINSSSTEMDILNLKEKEINFFLISKYFSNVFFLIKSVNDIVLDFIFRGKSYGSVNLEIFRF